MRKYTILHTIETAGPGGAETILLNLASLIDRRRFRSVVVLPEDRWLPKQVRARGIPTYLVKSKAWYDPHWQLALARIIRREKVDLIHSHLPDQNFYSCIAGRLARRKIIATYHGALPAPKSGDFKAQLKLWTVRRWASAVVVVSDYLKQSYKALGFPGDKMVRIYNGVDSARFSSRGKGALRTELGLQNGTKLVGMVANLRGSKGYEYFIQAAHKVSSVVPQVRFLAIGEMNQDIAGHMRSLLEKFSLQDRFLFLGFRQDVPEILNDLDVFVLSSISEGFSVATVEAMAAGKPVVVTRSGGPEEIVKHGSTGLLVPPADADALAEKICELLGNPGRASALAEKAQKEAKTKFGLGRMVSEYENLYERCLSSG